MILFFTVVALPPRCQRLRKRVLIKSVIGVVHGFWRPVLIRACRLWSSPGQEIVHNAAILWTTNLFIKYLLINILEWFSLIICHENLTFLLWHGQTDCWVYLNEPLGHTMWLFPMATKLWFDQYLIWSINLKVFKEMLQDRSLAKTPHMKIPGRSPAFQVCKGIFCWKH